MNTFDFDEDTVVLKLFCTIKGCELSTVCPFVFLCRDVTAPGSSIFCWTKPKKSHSETTLCWQVWQVHEVWLVLKVFWVDLDPAWTHQKKTVSCSPDTARNSLSQNALQDRLRCTADTLCCSSTETTVLTDRTWVTVTTHLLNYCTLFIYFTWVLE